MPFLLPAAATAVATAGTAVAATAATSTLASTLATVAMNAATSLAISAVMSALQPQVGAAGRVSEWTLDPDGPIPFAAGRIGVAGSVVYRKTFGPDLMYLGIPSVLSGAGPIDGYESFKADDENVVFDGNGKAVSSQYANELWYRRTMGSQPDVAVTSPPGLKSNHTLPGWGAQHRLSGKAAYMVVMGENSKGTAFPTGEIKPLITFRGLRGWDPRLDGSYPGGVGACRLDNPATWVYLANPILWALKWSLGLWEGPVGKGAPQVDYQVGGIGAKLSGIDVPAFVAAANVADANGWTVAAYPTTDDDKAQVLDAFLQAGGAVYAQRAGKISCIQRAAPRTSIVTVSAADTVGPIEIDTAASRIDRINTIRPRFWSEAHRWQLTALPEVTAAAYRAEDGGTRPRPLDYPYVSKAQQAKQLAALQIAHTREGIAGVIPLKPYLQRIRPGDAFTITEPGFVLNGVKCLCLATNYDPGTGIVSVTFVSETDAKYPFALGQSPIAPVPPVLEPVDPTYVSPPGETEWVVVPRPPSAGGAQIPGFDLVGEVDNATATALLVEWGPTAEGPWTQAYLGPPTAERIPLTGVQPNAVYYVSTINVRGQNYSERRVYGPFIAPSLIADDSVKTGGIPSDVVAFNAVQVPDLQTTLAGANLVIAQHEAALNTAVTGVVARVAQLVPAVLDPTTGLVTRMGTVETGVAGGVLRLNALEATVNTPTTGLSALVSGLQTTTASLSANKADASALALVAARADGVTRRTFVTDFAQDGYGWRCQYNGPPQDAWALGASGVHSGTYPVVAGVGKVLQIVVAAGSAYDLSNDALEVLRPNRRIRVKARFRQIAGNAGSMQPYIIPQSATYGLTAGYPSASFPVSAANVWIETDWLEVDSNTLIANGGVYWRGLFRLAAPAVGTGTFQVQWAISEDSTDAYNLAASVADETAARVGADGALAVRATVVEAAAFRQPGGIDNSNFGKWTAALPEKWGQYYGGETLSKVTGRVSANALRLTGGAGAYHAIYVNDTHAPLSDVRQNQWWVLEGVITLIAGSLSGASLSLLELTAAGVGIVNNFLNFFTDTDATGSVVGAGAVGRTYSFSKLVRVQSGSTAKGWLIASSHGQSGSSIAAANQLDFHFMNARLATAQEIEVGVARGADASLGARVTSIALATTTLENRLEARALLQVAAGNQVSGMQLLAVSGSDVAYSTIDFWASAVRISNGGLSPVAPFEVRGDVVRIKALLVDRIAASTSITLGAFAWPVAVEARYINAADGETVSYGGDIGQIPNLFFREDGLAALAAGEKYKQYADSHTATGFIARRKIEVPAAATAKNLTAAEAGPGGTGPDRMIQRGAEPVAFDNIYNITGRGRITFRSFATADEGQSGSVTMAVQQRVSGVWSTIGYLTVYPISASDPGFGSGAFNQNATADNAVQVTCSPSVDAWGLKYSSQSGGTAGQTTEILSVAYTAQAAGGGVRTATPGGQRPIIEVRRQNA